MTVQEVARTLNKSPQFIRVCLQRGLLPFGVACKMPNSNKYTYVIFKAKFLEYVGNDETIRLSTQGPERNGAI